MRLVGQGGLRGLLEFAGASLTVAQPPIWGSGRVKAFPDTRDRCEGWCQSDRSETTYRKLMIFVAFLGGRIARRMH